MTPHMIYATVAVAAAVALIHRLLLAVRIRGTRGQNAKQVAVASWPRICSRCHRASILGTDVLRTCAGRLQRVEDLRWKLKHEGPATSVHVSMCVSKPVPRGLGASVLRSPDPSPDPAFPVKPETSCPVGASLWGPSRGSVGLEQQVFHTRRPSGRCGYVQL